MDTKKFHAIGHSRLSDWAQKRAADMAGLGWAGMSATEKMRQQAHGGSASTAPGVLTAVEQHVDARGRTLQTELAVRALTEAQRAAVMAKYLFHRTMSVWAAEVGIDKSTASRRASDGVISVGQLLNQWPEHRRSSRR